MENEIIDLDEQGCGLAKTGEGSGGRGPGRRAVGTRVIGALVLGAALGIGIAEAHDSRQPKAEPEIGQLHSTPPVAVSAVASSVEYKGTSVSGDLRFEAQITVINAGARPIKARIAGAEQLPGLSIQPSDQVRELFPNQAGAIDVEVVADCSHGGWAYVPVRLSVETVDQGAHNVTFSMAYMGSAWENHVDRLCTENRRMP